MKEWEGQKEEEKKKRRRRRDRDKRNGFRVTGGRVDRRTGGRGDSKDWRRGAARRLVSVVCSVSPLSLSVLDLPPSLCQSACLLPARLTDVSIYPFLNGRESQREEEGKRGAAQTTVRSSDGAGDCALATTTNIDNGKERNRPSSPPSLPPSFARCARCRAGI